MKKYKIHRMGIVAAELSYRQDMADGPINSQQQWLPAQNLLKTGPSTFSPEWRRGSSDPILPEGEQVIKTCSGRESHTS